MDLHWKSWFLTIGLMAVPMTAMADCRNNDLMVQVEQCTEIVVTSSDNYDLGTSYLYRCQAYDMLGDYESAEDDCNTALTYLPKDASIFNSLSIIYFNQKKYAKSIASATTAISMKSDRGAYYNTRANSYCAVERYDNALADRMQALKLGHFTAEALQRYLANQGFYTGVIDGAFGSGSVSALEAWTRNGCSL